MIQLQRASAGSGKTFTLARKFIGYLISRPLNRSGAKRLCRTKGEILQSLRQILAITFTNMATTEMKQRIVEKLAALATATSSTPDGAIDYLSDFKKEFKASAEEIAEVCQIALETILNNFSDFNVSTIDSFFQGVLRTLAYETNLTESYQVEMDSDLLASIGIDSSLDQINTGSDTPARYWLDRLMEKSRDRGSQWNVFARSSRKTALYQRLLATAKKMENETYKQNREDIENYFRALEENGLTFRDIYEQLEASNESQVKTSHGVMAKAARALLRLLEAAPSEVKLKATPRSHAQLIASSRPFGNRNKDGKPTVTLFKYKKVRQDIDGGNVMTSSTGRSKKVMGMHGGFIQQVEEAGVAMYEAWLEWTFQQSTPRFLYWLLYRDNLLYLGLLHEIRRNVTQYLQDNGLVELSDTGVILQRIIDDNEVPFIYERLGTRLSHYLIDEFQDTSSLQWENMSPLLRESVGRGEESLVIGDAKQSIYRFRNADSEIISTILPKEFAGQHRACGDSVEENTNWRSDRRIVEFNNLFFHALAARTVDAGGAVGGAQDVYEGVVQRPSHKEQRGLVSIKFVSKTDAEPSSDDSGDAPAYFTDFGQLVQELLARGYRQRDIAFLVNTKKEGTEIIDTFVDFNSALPEGAERIEFVSEESLLVSSSKAVATIIAALKAISEPRTARLEEESERYRKGLGSWERIGGHFHLYVMQNGGVPSSELLEKFKNSLGTPDDPTLALQAEVGQMQAHTLPAIVEMAIGRFVSKEEALRETPYIAAFQDIVLEYSERNPADIASFLRWWDTTGSRRSITSPKDIDAVKVMTIHKSKGLQFKCVIVPEVAFSFSPSASKTEWLWVDPDPSVGITPRGCIPLPPKVAVESGELGKLLKEQAENDEATHAHLHESTFSAYAHAYMMDILNKVYVAFTRAEEELHIYVPAAKTMTGKIRKNLEEALGLSEPEEEAPTPDDEAGEKSSPLSATFGNMAESLLTISLHIADFIGATDEARARFMPGETADIHISVEPAREPDEELREDERHDGQDEESKPQMREYRDTEIGRIEVGHPRTAEERETDRQRQEEKRRQQEAMRASAQPEVGEISIGQGYVSNSFPKSLRFRDPDAGILTGEEEETETYIDPRSEGNIIHAVLERMRTASDLDRALRHMRVKGRLTASGERELKAKLSAMLADPTAAAWFAEGLRVLNERTLLSATSNMTIARRPDRMTVDERGNAIVIDYKTGKELPAHKKQVGRYVSLLRSLHDNEGTPLFRSVEGWLWYLVEDKKVKV